MVGRKPRPIFRITDVMENLNENMMPNNKSIRQGQMPGIL